MAAADDNGAQAEDVVIARIVKPRGIRGEVACDIETDFPERFGSLERVTVWMPDESRLALKIEGHRFHKHRVILKFEGYDTMTAAEELVGGRLVIREADARELDENEFYEYSIVGSEVVTTGGETLGRVTRLMRTGGTDLLVIEGEDGRELLVPFADDICAEVDTDAGRITVNPPEGLLEL
ncbi:MAG TPA: ribosome maturation factor RimM [Blastocatellia bacterium]|nr:ribosome maturation factor RimM [Blastocatellia bacterium]